jgi:hypothetical protein
MVKLVLTEHHDIININYHAQTTKCLGTSLMALSGYVSSSSDTELLITTMQHMLTNQSKQLSLPTFSSSSLCHHGVYIKF